MVGQTRHAPAALLLPVSRTIGAGWRGTVRRSEASMRPSAKPPHCATVQPHSNRAEKSARINAHPACLRSAGRRNTGAPLATSPHCARGAARGPSARSHQRSRWGWRRNADAGVMAAMVTTSIGWRSGRSSGGQAHRRGGLIAMWATTAWPLEMRRARRRRGWREPLGVISSRCSVPFAVRLPCRRPNSTPLTRSAHQRMARSGRACRTAVAPAGRNVLGNRR